MIAVPCEASGWGCLQIVDLKRSGPGSLATFIAGVLPWYGVQPPTLDDVQGLAVVEQAMVHKKLFTEAGLQVVTSFPVIPTALTSNFRDRGVGTIHHVWGWRTAMRKAEAVAMSISLSTG